MYAPLPDPRARVVPPKWPAAGVAQATDAEERELKRARRNRWSDIAAGAAAQAVQSVPIANGSSEPASASKPKLPQPLPRPPSGKQGDAAEHLNTPQENGFEICLTNLPKSWDVKDVQELCDSYGKLKGIRPRKPGHFEASFFSAGEAEKAVRGLNRLAVPDAHGMQTIACEFVSPPPPAKAPAAQQDRPRGPGGKTPETGLSALDILLAAADGEGDIGGEMVASDDAASWAKMKRKSSQAELEDFTNKVLERLKSVGNWKQGERTQQKLRHLSERVAQEVEKASPASLSDCVASIAAMLSKATNPQRAQELAPWIEAEVEVLLTVLQQNKDAVAAVAAEAEAAAKLAAEAPAQQPPAAKADAWDQWDSWETDGGTAAQAPGACSTAAGHPSKMPGGVPPPPPGRHSHVAQRIAPPGDTGPQASIACQNGAHVPPPKAKAPVPFMAASHQVQVDACAASDGFGPSAWGNPSERPWNPSTTAPMTTEAPQLTPQPGGPGFPPPMMGTGGRWGGGAPPGPGGFPEAIQGQPCQASPMAPLPPMSTPCSMNGSMGWQQAAPMAPPAPMGNQCAVEGRAPLSMEWQQAAPNHAPPPFVSPGVADASTPASNPLLQQAHALPFMPFPAPPPPEPQEGQQQQPTMPPPPPDPEPEPQPPPQASHQEKLRELLQAQQQQLQGIMKLGGGGTSSLGLNSSLGSSPLTTPSLLDPALQAACLQPTPSPQDLLAQMQLQAQLQQAQAAAQQNAMQQMQLLAMAQAQASQSPAMMQTPGLDFNSMMGGAGGGVHVPEVLSNGLPTLPALPVPDQLMPPQEGDKLCGGAEAVSTPVTLPALENIAPAAAGEVAAAPASARLDPLQEEILSMLQTSLPLGAGQAKQGV